jgi:hypothetical protein
MLESCPEIREHRSLLPGFAQSRPEEAGGILVGGVLGHRSQEFMLLDLGPPDLQGDSHREQVKADGSAGEDRKTEEALRLLYSMGQWFTLVCPEICGVLRQS